MIPVIKCHGYQIWIWMDLVSRNISWQVNDLSSLVDATLRPLAESAESAGVWWWWRRRFFVSRAGMFICLLFWGFTILRQTHFFKKMGVLSAEGTHGRQLETYLQQNDTSAQTEVLILRRPTLAHRPPPPLRFTSSDPKRPSDCGTLQTAAGPTAPGTHGGLHCLC